MTKDELDSLLATPNKVLVVDVRRPGCRCGRLGDLREEGGKGVAHIAVPAPPAAVAHTEH